MQKIQKQKKLFICNIKIAEICYLHFPKKSKSNYYNQYFRANMSNIKNTWTDIKYNYITIKNLYSDIFLTAIWLPYSQVWATVEGADSLTNLMFITVFLLILTRRSLGASNWGPKPSQATCRVRTRNL